MPCPDEYVIDRILPKNLFSLTSGPSDAGKSSFWYLALAMIEAGIPVLGQDVQSLPFVIVSYDRTMEEVKGVLRRLGLDDRHTDIIPAFGNENKSDSQIWVEIDKRKHAHKIVLWEGIDGVVKNRNNSYEVRNFCSEIAAHCSDEHITLIGTGGIAKMKPWEMYDDARQLAAGSEWWGRSAATMFVMRKFDPENVQDPRRVMEICPKTAPGCRVCGRFDGDGMLEFDPYGSTYSDLQLPDYLKKHKNGNRR